MDPIAAAAVDANPAGGAAIWEAIVASLAGLAVTVALLWVGWAHRTGRISWLGRIADGAGRLTGMPRWAALPAMLTGVTLVVAVFGMYWDISLHIGAGRDAGPFANPAHFFILAGLFGIFIAGFLALVLPEGKPSRAAVRIGRDWYAPLGAVGLIAASGFALLGFPLDDFWHRIFGQDVTLWGPTHLMMIGGAALAFIGQATLLGEARAEGEGEVEVAGLVGRIATVLVRLRYALLAGGFLIGLSTFQAEFDFGVPQFRMLFGPVLVMFAAATALVGARIYAGRGAAFVAVGLFIVVRGGLALTIGPVLGEPTPYFPLYLGAAALVEGLALLIGCNRRPYLFGALAGALIGTVGLLSEYAWSQLFMPIPWTGSLLAEVAVIAPPVAIGSGLLGAFIGNAWRLPQDPTRTPRLPLAPAAAGLLAVVVAVGYGLQTAPERDVTATVSLRELETGPQRSVAATVRVEPPSAAEDANWLNATAWQGGGLHVDRLEPVRGADGAWRTTEPLPVHGTWKSVIRLHREGSLVGVPVYMPADRAIPAPEVPAPARFERSFIADHQILQREQLDDVPAWLATAAYLTIGLIVLAIVLLLGWSLHRLTVVYAAGPPRGPRYRRGGATRRRGAASGRPEAAGGAS
jgi:hypothetical protein